MNKILIYITTLVLTFSITSCNDDVENFNSNTIDYSGRYVIKVLNEDASKVLKDYSSTEYRIYNTSKNITNEVWIACTTKKFLLPIKQIFSLNGTAEAFSSNNDFNNIKNDLNSVISPENTPTALDQTKTEDRKHIRAVILEGKILANAAETPGGNKTDGISLKIKFLSGSVTYKSVAVPKDLWADPDKEEFKWEIESATYDSSKDETFVIQGYRYTGFPEDEL